MSHSPSTLLSPLGAIALGYTSGLRTYENSISNFGRIDRLIFTTFDDLVDANGPT